MRIFFTVDRQPAPVGRPAQHHPRRLGRAALAGDHPGARGLHPAAHELQRLDRADHGWRAAVGGGGKVVPGGEAIDVFRAAVQTFKRRKQPKRGRPT